MLLPLIYTIIQPWYLATAAVAEQLYDALIVWKQQGSLTITSTSLAFFQQFSSSVSTGTFPSSTSTFTTITSAVQIFADGFLAINAKYTPPNGGLSEQYDKNTGSPLSAADLTWSYASALTAFAARKGLTFASWGAKGLIVPSGACEPNAGPTVQVTFNVVATTQFGGMCAQTALAAVIHLLTLLERKHLPHWKPRCPTELVAYNCSSSKC